MPIEGSLSGTEIVNEGTGEPVDGLEGLCGITSAVAARGAIILSEPIWFLDQLGSR